MRSREWGEGGGGERERGEGRESGGDWEVPFLAMVAVGVRSGREEKRCTEYLCTE